MRINQVQFSNQLREIMSDQLKGAAGEPMHVKDFISAASSHLLIPLYYAAIRIDQARFQSMGEEDWRVNIKLPDNTELKAGPEDPYYDHIPNGLLFLSGVCEIILSTFQDGISADELRVKLNMIFKEWDFYAQDATPGPISDVVKLIAQALDLDPKYIEEHFH